MQRIDYRMIADTLGADILVAAQAGRAREVLALLMNHDQASRLDEDARGRPRPLSKMKAEEKRRAVWRRVDALNRETPGRVT